MYSALTQLETPLIHVSRVLPTHLLPPADEWKRVSNPIYSLANYRFISLSNFLSICQYTRAQTFDNEKSHFFRSFGHHPNHHPSVFRSFGRSSFLSIIGLFVCLSICSFILSLSLSPCFDRNMRKFKMKAESRHKI